DDRRRHGYVAAASTEPPELFAVVETISADVLEAVRDDVRHAIVDRDGRGRPCRHLIALRAPDDVAALEIERRDEGLILHVALDEDAIAKDHRRASEAPLHAAIVEEARVEEAEVALPERLPVDVVAVDAFRSEEGDDALAVRRRRRVRVARLRVTADLRHALVRDDLPSPFA